MVAPTYFAAHYLNLGSVTYNTGDVVDVSTWDANYLNTALRLGWVAEDLSNPPGSEIAASILSANYVMTNAFVTVPSWQVVVPANSGTIEVGVPEGLLVNIVTGTNAAGTAFTVSLRIEDEANALVGFTQWQIFSSSAGSQGWASVVPLMKSVPNNIAVKTYHVAAKMDKVGTLSATSTIFTAASGFTNPTLRAVRR